jgi:nitroreductase
MDFDEVVRRRRMVRRFTDAPVATEARERIVAAGLRAPSAGFSQGHAFLVLEKRSERDRLWATHSDGAPGWAPEVAEGVRRAPLLVAVLASKELYLDRYALADKGWTDRDEARWAVPYWYVDAGCAAMLILLAAVAEGLGALLFGIRAEDVDRFREAFGVPLSFDLVGVVAIGHEDKTAPRRDLRSRRRSPAELVHRGYW